MANARKEMLDILEGIKQDPHLAKDGESANFAVITAGFVMLGKRADRIIELLEDKPPPPLKS